MLRGAVSMNAESRHSIPGVRVFFVAVLVASACTPPRSPAVVAPPPRAPLTGTVVGDAGPVMVAVTDTKTGWPVEVVEADAGGRFAAHVPAGDYALAITSPRGSRTSNT